MSESISRRSAITAAGVVVVGGAAGYVTGRNTAAAKADSAPPTANPYGNSSTSGRGSKALAKVADIPDGGGVIIHHPAVVITRAGSAVHAFSAVCTHQGCLVDKVRDGRIACPCHGSVFDAATGKVVGGPAPSPLPQVRVAVRNGEVFPA